MLSIGNDIIDLKYGEPALHPRYKQRVLTQNEIDQNLDIFQCWSAKEAAYKLLKRQNPSLVFSPGKFEYIPKEGCVQYENITLKCHLDITDYRLHAICSTPEITSGLSSWTTRQSQNSQNESEAVQSFAIENISRLLKIAASDCQIVKKEKIPFLQIEHKLTSHLLSFSHHGDWLGVVFLEQ